MCGGNNENNLLNISSTLAKDLIESHSLSKSFLMLRARQSQFDYIITFMDFMLHSIFDFLETPWQGICKL